MMIRIATLGLALVSAGCVYNIPSGDTASASLLSSLLGRVNDGIVSVTSAREGATLNSGFLHGTAAATNIAGVEVSVNGGAYTGASGTETWSWQLPAGPTGMRIGTSYTLNIRVRDTSGTYSNIATFNIRKGVNRDVNGDGIADLAVGAGGYNSGQGRAYLFYGNTNGLTAANAAGADSIFTGEAGSTSFGGNLALADINADGYADLIAGASQYNSGQGRAYIFYSAGSAGIATANANTAGTILTGPGTGDSFGNGFSTGDVNSDGYTDLAVGASGNGGAVHLYHSGGAAGINNGAAASAVVTNASGTFLGFSSALGDINGDGFADLITGRLLDGGGASDGTVYAFLSGGASGIASTTTASANTILTGEASSFLGTDFILADINNDGYQDAIIGASQYNGGDGRVYIYYGSASGIASGAATDAPVIITGESGSGLSRVAAGDVNGDGFADILMAAGNYSVAVSDGGRAYVFHGSASGIASASPTAASAIFTGNQANKNLGSALSLKDLNGDGFDDVFVSAAGFFGASDPLYYFPSAGSSGPVSQDLNAGGTAGAEIVGEGNLDSFGSSISR